VAAVIRHVLAEGWLLVRSRAVITLGLAIALAVPISLAGITVAGRQWLAPVIDLSQRETVVTVLLHPRLDEVELRSWIAGRAAEETDWRLELVPPDALADRLGRWFPYLEEVLDREGPVMLPPLVEITTRTPDEVGRLRDDPDVLAVGPTTSVNRVVGTASRGFAAVLMVIAAALAAGAAVLAAVWVHLELHRHAEEIAIMRLMGATEAMVRGPFVLAVTVPGAIAAAASMVMTGAVTGWMVRLAEPLGMTAPGVVPWVLAGQALASIGLPLATALVSLERHAAMMDG
jgi:cell division protein FtsX